MPSGDNVLNFDDTEERMPMRLSDEVFYGGTGIRGGRELKMSELLKIYWVRVIVDEVTEK